MELDAIPFIQRIPVTVFQHDKHSAHITRNIQAFLSAQQVQLLPWPAYLSDMLPIKHVWDYVGERVALNAHTIDELWFQIVAIFPRYRLKIYLISYHVI